MDISTKTREYAMASKDFGYKTTIKKKSGYWTPEGEFIEVPVGVSRVRFDKNKDKTDGWIIGYWDRSALIKVTKYFLDKDYPGKSKEKWKASLLDAITVFNKATLGNRAGAELKW